MRLLILSAILLVIFQLLLPPATTITQDENQQKLQLSAERTRAIALLFSLIQCFPNETNGANNVNLDTATQSVLQINQKFDPAQHLNEYENLTEIQNLIDLSDSKDSTHFIRNLQIILVALWHNAENWSLFFSTAAWLIGRVDSEVVFWALYIVSVEKYSDTVTVPSAVEIFPQLFVPKLKQRVLNASALESRQYVSDNALSYWQSDPGLNQAYHYITRKYISFLS